MPVPWDEYPIHQVPMTLARMATSDRNAYDRCYLHAHNRVGGTFFISGLGVYPNLGVIDAYAAVRIGEEIHTAHYSDSLGDNRQEQRVGPYRIEVIKPLQSLRVVCDGDGAVGGVNFDLTWTGSFPAVEEQPHRVLADGRLILDSARFCQLGRWQGTLEAAGQSFAVLDWDGMRDRSWGIRPIGEAAPPGRPPNDQMSGFYWVYVPLQFDDYAVILIVQESSDGYRTLNDATRIWPDGRVEQLGWPRIEIDYRAGTRHPLGARLHCSTPAGAPLVFDIETFTNIPLHVGCGYPGDPDFGHGRWYGPEFAAGHRYDLTDPTVAARIPWGVTDHVARASCDGAIGWGMFEHGSIGRHDPSGFTDFLSVAL